MAINVSTGQSTEEKRCDETVSVGSLALGIEACRMRAATDDIGVVDFAKETRVNGSKSRLGLQLDAPVGGVLFKDRRASEAEELGVREELFDCPVVLAELGAGDLTGFGESLSGGS